MKLRPTADTPARPPAEQPQPAAKRTPEQPVSPETAAALGGARSAERRDFDSVFKEVSRKADRAGEREDKKSGERAGGPERPRETEREAVRRDEGQEAGHGGGATPGRFMVGEPLTLSEATTARAILHIVDLEKIVSTVRSQALAGGGHEVTLELKRSVLEGLSVRLSADGAGRVTAEFVAASERVRAQVEARSAELADLLLARGVNLADIKTSLGGRSQGDGGRGGEPNDEGQTASSVESAASTAARADEPDESPGAEGGWVYRA